MFVYVKLIFIVAKIVGPYDQNINGNEVKWAFIYLLYIYFLLRYIFV